MYAYSYDVFPEGSAEFVELLILVMPCIAQHQCMYVNTGLWVSTCSMTSDSLGTDLYTCYHIISSKVHTFMYEDGCHHDGLVCNFISNILL